MYAQLFFTRPSRVLSFPTCSLRHVHTYGIFVLGKQVNPDVEEKIQPPQQPLSTCKAQSTGDTLVDTFYQS